jgi:porphobilinogen synthase
MQRFRKFRTDSATRDYYADVRLEAQNLIQPCFVVEGRDVRREIPSLTGIYHLSIDQLLEDVKHLKAAGVNKILLFGAVEGSLKNSRGTAAYAPDNLVARAIAAVKTVHPDSVVMSDVCLCGYTDHGHCGLVAGNEVLNDETLPLLAAMATTHAQAGADFVAPSAMMDGQVGAIRQALDQAGLTAAKILAYSAKYASGFYGPFRGAAGSAPAFGDRSGYQMDYRNTSQALGEVAADIGEGADWVMVKPALAYLDIIRRVKYAFPQAPLVAYHVSGEYMMLKAAAAAGVLDEHRTMLETLYAIKRSGANYIITYYALEAGKLLASMH